MGEGEEVSGGELVVGVTKEEEEAADSAGVEDVEGTTSVDPEETCALTEPKECDSRTTREKSVRMRTADAEQQRMVGGV